MERKIHFISGLPRSGSTLLSAILKQNPKFTASISDPLQGYVGSIIRDTVGAVGIDSLVPIERRRELIKDLIQAYYKNGNEVCFNTNRGWTNNTSLLKNLYPDFKMIVCLRDIPWILDSFEQLNSKNPYTIKPLYHHQELASVHDRSSMLMGEIPNFVGYVHGPLVGVQQSMFSNEKDHLCFLDYDTLIDNPEECMKQIYNFLGEPYFKHDFDDIEDSYDEFDEGAKIEGLHKVRKKLEFLPRESILPGELWNKYEPMSFWKYNFEQGRKLNWIGPTYQKQRQHQHTHQPQQMMQQRPNSLQNTLHRQL